jgi:hypothetical protein
MWFQNPFKRFLQGTVNGGRRRPMARRRRGRPACVQQLEVRTLPSSFTAVTVSDLIADINAANETPEADTITLAPGATFTLQDRIPKGYSGLPVIAAGENLTIIGNGDVIERNTAAGTPAFRLFQVAAGASLNLQDLTLQGGIGGAVASPGPGLLPFWAGGGAVYNQGTLNLTGVTVQNNIAVGNGGSSGSWINYPAGNAGGGGVWSSGVLTITDSIIANNQAVGGHGADGARSVNGSGSSPGEGGNGYGGGVYIAGGTATITGTSITGNTALGGDGGRITNDPRAKALKSGTGIGGGIFIDGLAWVGMDSFTSHHVKGNKASSNHNDIFGHFEMIA